MKRTTVVLPPELKSLAQRQAERLGVSMAELIRQSLSLRLRPPHRDSVRDPLLDDDVVYTGPGPRDTAKDHDRYLYGESE
jgi:Arc/MetJ-type ribon-helix-helix transcriptional regulator